MELLAPELSRRERAAFNMMGLDDYERKAIRGVGLNELLAGVQFLKQLLKIFNTQASIPRDTAHCKCIHRIMTRNSYDTETIRHNNVLTLTIDPKASLSPAP